MAEAFLNARCRNDFAATSAGLEPGQLNPLAVQVMREVGIDISGSATTNAFDLFKDGKQFSYVVTVCDETSGERCPVFPGGARRLHWSFPDPSAIEGTPADRLEQTRNIRDAIEAKVSEWCEEVCNDIGG